MMETKQKYFSPECEIVELQMAGVIATSKTDQSNANFGDGEFGGWE